jgi:hypothetical protein
MGLSGSILCHSKLPSSTGAPFLNVNMEAGFFSTLPKRPPWHRRCSRCMAERWRRSLHGRFFSQCLSAIAPWSLLLPVSFTSVLPVVASSPMVPTSAEQPVAGPSAWRSSGGGNSFAAGLSLPVFECGRGYPEFGSQPKQLHFCGATKANLKIGHWFGAPVEDHIDYLQCSFKTDFEI